MTPDAANANQRASARRRQATGPGSIADAGGLKGAMATGDVLALDPASGRSSETAVAPLHRGSLAGVFPIADE
jgi:hypothetical protein